MSVETTDTDQETIDSIDDLSGCFPQEYNGWTRYDEGRGIISYWRRRQAQSQRESYQCLRVSQVGERYDGKPKMRIRRVPYDKFGHRDKRTYTIAEPTPDRVVESLKREMDDHNGNGDFTTPPTIPTAIDEWELTIENRTPAAVDGRDPHNLVRITKWERGFGKAQLILEQTDIESHYSHTNHKHTIRYREVDAYFDGVAIARDVPRTAAYEIAVYMMKRWDAPVSDLQARQKALQQIKGIGPAKAESLVLLGVDSPAQLAVHLQSDSPVVNWHHDEAIDKLVTTMIREEIAAIAGVSPDELTFDSIPQ
jgi:hypothetical protein